MGSGCGWSKGEKPLPDVQRRHYVQKHSPKNEAKAAGNNPRSSSGRQKRKSTNSIGQKISGQQIDPYADPFFFGQATSTIRQQVGAEITRNYGNEDGTDNLGSWLMRSKPRPYKRLRRATNNSWLFRQSAALPFGGPFLLPFHACRPGTPSILQKRIPVGRNLSLLFATVRLRGAHSPRWPFGKTMHDTSERR